MMFDLVVNLLFQQILVGHQTLYREESAAHADHGMLLQEFPAEQHLVDFLAVHPLRHRVRILCQTAFPPFSFLRHRIADRRAARLAEELPQPASEALHPRP